MIRFVFTAILFCILSTSTQSLALAPGEVLIDRVLAIVNGRSIFYSDIRR